MGQGALDEFDCLDEVQAVAVVFLDAGRHGKDVGIKNDVFGREIQLLGQQLVGAGADFHLARDSVGLTHLVEGHDDHGRAITAHQSCLVEEGLFAFLHRDGIDDALALKTLEAGLEDVPLGGIQHHRDAGDVGLGGDQIDEAHHRRLGVEHALVHVDVDDLCAVLDLLAGHFQRFFIFLLADQAAEGGGAGDVGAFADIHEQGFGAYVQRLQAGQPAFRFDDRNAPGREVLYRVMDGLDMRRSGAATTANDVEEALLGPFSDLLSHGLGGLVVLAEFIRQAGVGMGRDMGVGDVRQFLDVLAQLLGT